MGVAYHCDAETGCTFIVWDAEVTPEEWSAREDELFTDPTFPPGPIALVDLRSAAGAPHVSMTVVQEMGDRLRRHAPQIGPLRMAVIPNSAWDKVLAFEERLEGSGISSIAFTSVPTACVWLGLDSERAMVQLGDLREKLRA